MKARSWTLQSLAGAALLASWAGSAVAQPGAAPPMPTAPSSPGKVAAVVNGETVTAEDVETALKDRPLPTNLTSEQRDQLKFQALGMLIDDHLLQQFLHKTMPPPKDAEVSQKQAEVLRACGHSMQDFCREHGMTEQRLHENVASMVQWLGYVHTHLNDAELKRYYDNNRDVFDVVTVRASHVLLRLPANATDAQRQAAQAQLLNLRQQIVSGQIDFGVAAKQYSHCPSRERGGDLGYFPRKFAVDEEFARAAFALQTGQVSTVVQTNMGLHLIKVTDRKQGQTTSFEKIKDEVREVAAEEMRQQLLAEQRKVAKIEIMQAAPPLKTPAQP